MCPQALTNDRRMLHVVGTAVFFCAATVALAGTTEQQERHFAVKDKPVVILDNIVNGRIEVKSSKNPEVVVTSTSVADKVTIEIEQVGDRIDINASSTVPSTEPHDVEANFQLVVPEQTELRLKTQTGLILVEQVNGDMTLQSVAGDVHLKEVSGYIIVTTTGGSLVCTLCSGRLDFTSISGSAQVLQPSLNNANLRTTTGNILYDGDFLRTGLYTMNSGRGMVEVRFSGNDSFDLNAKTYSGTVDNQAADFLKPDTHGSKHHSDSKFSKSLVGTVGQGLAKVELSSYSGTIRILKRD
jgi:Putative adhesin